MEGEVAARAVCRVTPNCRPCIGICRRWRFDGERRQAGVFSEDAWSILALPDESERADTMQLYDRMSKDQEVSLNVKT